MMMIKSKFDGFVRSRLPAAQANEIYCKVIAHNLACIIQAIAEFGIAVDFDATGKPMAAADVAAVDIYADVEAERVASSDDGDEDDDKADVLSEDTIVTRGPVPL
jgi:hypothetical protein